MKTATLACLMMIAAPAMAEELPQDLSKSDLGFSTPADIDTGKTSSAIDMHDGRDGLYHHLSVEFLVEWGTSTSFSVKLLRSNNSSGTYRYYERCTSGSPHVCAPRVWQFSSTDGTAPSLDFLYTSHRYLKFEIVAGAGTGVVSATGTRGK